MMMVRLLMVALTVPVPRVKTVYVPAPFKVIRLVSVAPLPEVSPWMVVYDGRLRVAPRVIVPLLVELIAELAKVMVASAELVAFDAAEISASRRLQLVSGTAPGSDWLVQLAADGEPESSVSVVTV